MRRFLSLLIIMSIVMLSFCACGETETSNKTLSFPVLTNPGSLDPQIASDTGARIAAVNCFQGLYRLGADGEPIADAAVSCDVSADGLTYTFTLNQSSRWHLISGLEDMLGESYKTDFDTRVTADDFVFALRRAVAPETNAPDAAKLFMIKNAEKIHSGDAAADTLGVTAQGSYTLIIELEQRSNELFRVLASPVSMPCNEAFFEASKGRYGLSVDKFLCNGAFYLSKWIQDSSLLFKRNPDYLSGDTQAAPVPAAFRLYVNSDVASITENLAESAYDAAFITLPQDKSVLGECSITEYENITEGLMLNPSNKFLADADIRLALIKSLDRDTVLSAAGNLSIAKGFVPDACKINGSAYRETAGALEYGIYDEQQAKQLWNSGTQRLGTEAVSLVISCCESNKTALGKVMQNWQRVLGVSLSVTLRVLSDKQLAAATAAGDFDIAFTKYECSDFSAYGFLSGVFFSSLLPESYFDSLSAAASAQSTEQAAAHCLEAEKILLETAVFYPVCTSKTCFVLAQGSSEIYPALSNDKIYFRDGRRTD
ncbi:MAG: peptide ABC transporter substrate-binding protein [Clostridiales bacterium]|nr:peptide ABC transporter substrate-binding protein [Clostridiales bacterium]